MVRFCDGSSNGTVSYTHLDVYKRQKKSKSSLSNHRLVLWKSLREMESDPDLMGRNKDIVMALEEIKTKIVDTFENTYSPIHIIWNITKECAYDCAICATRDASRKELPTEKKLTESQSAGRGRRGRSWESPAGESIYMSLLLRPEFPPVKAPMPVSYTHLFQAELSTKRLFHWMVKTEPMF